MPSLIKTLAKEVTKRQTGNCHKMSLFLSGIMFYIISLMLTEQLRSELQKNYEPFSLITTRHKGADIVFKADEEGNPVLLFIGRMNEKGWVKGKRFSRTLEVDSSGNVIKDQWELKGMANYG